MPKQSTANLAQNLESQADLTKIVSTARKIREKAQKILKKEIESRKNGRGCKYQQLEKYSLRFLLKLLQDVSIFPLETYAKVHLQKENGIRVRH